MQVKKMVAKQVQAHKQTSVKAEGQCQMPMQNQIRDYAMRTNADLDIDEEYECQQQQQPMRDRHQYQYGRMSDQTKVQLFKQYYQLNDQLSELRESSVAEFQVSISKIYKQKYKLVELYPQLDEQQQQPCNTTKAGARCRHCSACAQPLMQPAQMQSIIQRALISICQTHKDIIGEQMRLMLQVNSAQYYYNIDNDYFAPPAGYFDSFLYHQDERAYQNFNCSQNQTFSAQDKGQKRKIGKKMYENNKLQAQLINKTPSTSTNKQTLSKLSSSQLISRTSNNELGHELDEIQLQDLPVRRLIVNKNYYSYCVWVIYQHYCSLSDCNKQVCKLVKQFQKSTQSIYKKEKQMNKMKIKDYTAGNAISEGDFSKQTKKYNKEETANSKLKYRSKNKHIYKNKTNRVKSSRIDLIDDQQRQGHCKCKSNNNSSKNKDGNSVDKWQQSEQAIQIGELNILMLLHLIPSAIPKLNQKQLQMKIEYASDRHKQRLRSKHHQTTYSQGRSTSRNGDSYNCDQCNQNEDADFSQFCNSFTNDIYEHLCQFESTINTIIYSSHQNMRKHTLFLHQFRYAIQKLRMRLSFTLDEHTNPTSTATDHFCVHHHDNRDNANSNHNTNSKNQMGIGATNRNRNDITTQNYGRNTNNNDGVSSNSKDDNTNIENCSAQVQAQVQTQIASKQVLAQRFRFLNKTKELEELNNRVMNKLKQLQQQSLVTLSYPHPQPSQQHQCLVDSQQDQQQQNGVTVVQSRLRMSIKMSQKMHPQQQNQKLNKQTDQSMLNSPNSSKGNMNNRIQVSDNGLINEIVLSRKKQDYKVRKTETSTDGACMGGDGKQYDRISSITQISAKVSSTNRIESLKLQVSIKDNTNAHQLQLNSIPMNQGKLSIMQQLQHNLSSIITHPNNAQVNANTSSNTNDNTNSSNRIVLNNKVYEYICNNNQQQQKSKPVQQSLPKSRLGDRQEQLMNIIRVSSKCPNCARNQDEKCENCKRLHKLEYKQQLYKNIEMEKQREKWRETQMVKIKIQQQKDRQRELQLSKTNIFEKYKKQLQKLGINKPTKTVTTSITPSIDSKNTKLSQKAQTGTNKQSNKQKRVYSQELDLDLHEYLRKSIRELRDSHEREHQQQKADEDQINTKIIEQNGKDSIQKKSKKKKKKKKKNKQQSSNQNPRVSQDRSEMQYKFEQQQIRIQQLQQQSSLQACTQQLEQVQLTHKEEEVIKLLKNMKIKQQNRLKCSNLDVTRFIYIKQQYFASSNNDSHRLSSPGHKMKKNKVSKNLGKFEVAANLNTNMENTQEVDKSKVKQKSVSKKSKIKGKKQV